MEFSIDSYDWVMVPNVYGMGLFADGGSISTKVYISSGAYLQRMSGMKRDKEIDVLYYYFIHRNYDKLIKTHRSKYIVGNWKRKTKKEKDDIIKIGKSIVGRLTKGTR
jgi:deoxyribodipyrimidine photolyase-related protein